MDNNSQIAFEEFVKYCDIFLVRAKYSKRDLADKLAIEYTSFSKMYNGARPIPGYLLEKIKQICSEPILPTPEKIAIQEHLPLDAEQMRSAIARLEALQDQERKNSNELRDKVAVLEDRLEQAKLDGEKKRREHESDCAYTIRNEIERATSRLARPGKAANDE